MSRKEIVYPICLECVIYAETQFWKQVFEDLVYGITPTGTYLFNNMLVCKQKGKEFAVPLDTHTDPKELYDVVYSKLSSVLKLSTSTEKKKILDDTLCRAQIESKHENWTSIKKKSIKDMLIIEYLLSNKREYNLTDKQIKELKTIIDMGLIFKTIDSKDILYKDGIIENIRGIGFNNKETIIEDNVIDYRPISVESTTVQPQIKKISDIWINRKL